MPDPDSLNKAFRDTAPADKGPMTKRQMRAMRTRERALSPVRILLSLMMVPVVATTLTVAIYIRTSDFDDTDALRHLIAMAGCDAAVKVQAAPAAMGQPGYHKRNDPDGDGIACDDGTLALVQRAAPEMPAAPEVEQRFTGGAKFIKP